MVNTGKGLPDVDPQHVKFTVFVVGRTQKVLQLQNGGVRTFAMATGVGIKYKYPLKQRLNLAYQGVVDYSIGKGGGRDITLFGVVDLEGSVFAVPITTNL